MIKINGGVWGPLGIDGLERLWADANMVREYLCFARYGRQGPVTREELLNNLGLGRWLQNPPENEIERLDKHITDLGPVIRHLMNLRSWMPSDIGQCKDLVNRVLTDEAPQKNVLLVALLCADKIVHQVAGPEQQEWSRKKQELAEKYQDLYPEDPYFDEP